MITAEFPPNIIGGSGVSAGLLVQQLRQKGILVDVYVFEIFSQNTFLRILSQEGHVRYRKLVMVPGTVFEFFLDLQLISTLFDRLGIYDLVHLYGTFSAPALGFLRRSSLKVPVVVTLNDIIAACSDYHKWMKVRCEVCTFFNFAYCRFIGRAGGVKRSRLAVTPMAASYFLIRRWFAKSLDKYLALSSVMKGMYVSAGFPEDKITILPNMYDPSFLEKLNQLKTEEVPEKTTVLYVGRLSKEKGVDDLIRAFSMTESEEMQCWIVGEGPEKKRLIDLANRVCRQKQIRFLDFVDYRRLPAIYKSADIFVHPGRWPEPFGRTILEAMLAKLPIVASDSGAIPEVLNDGGIIYKTGDISGLAESLETLAEDSNLRQRLGQRVYGKCIRDYSPEAITNRILTQYRALIA